MTNYALLKGHITDIVSMGLVRKYMRRNNLIPKISVRNSHILKSINVNDLTTVYVEDVGDYYRIVGDESSCPE
jgi:hypothetical protein